MKENGSDHILLLRGIDESDLGNYTCLAVNKVGESETTIRLTGETNSSRLLCRTSMLCAAKGVLTKVCLCSKDDSWGVMTGNQSPPVNRSRKDEKTIRKQQEVMEL